MFVILGVALILFGVCLLTSPKSYYKLKESWKSTSYSEPSPLYLILVRAAGGFFCVLGILLIVVQFI